MVSVTPLLRTTLPTQSDVDRKLAESRRRLSVCEDTVKLRQDEANRLADQSIQLRFRIVGAYVDRQMATKDAKGFGAIGGLGAALFAAGYCMSATADVGATIMGCGVMCGIISGVFLASKAGTYLNATRQTRLLEKQATKLDSTLQSTQAALEVATRERLHVLSEVRRWQGQQELVRMASGPRTAAQIRVGPEAVVVGEVRVPRRPGTAQA